MEISNLVMDILWHSQLMWDSSICSVSRDFSATKRAVGLIGVKFGIVECVRERKMGGSSNSVDHGLCWV